MVRIKKAGPEFKDNLRNWSINNYHFYGQKKKEIGWRYEGALSEVKLVPLRHSLSFVPGRRRKLQAVWPATKPHFWVLTICLFLELALPWGHGFLNGKSSHLFGSHSSASLLHMLSMSCSSCCSHYHWADVTQSWQNDHLHSPCKPQTKKFINMKAPLLLFFSNSSSHGNNKLAKVQCVLFKFFNIPKHFFLCVLKIGSGHPPRLADWASWLEGDNRMRDHGASRRGPVVSMGWWRVIVSSCSFPDLDSLSTPCSFYSWTCPQTLFLSLTHFLLTSCPAAALTWQVLTPLFAFQTKF